MWFKGDYGGAGLAVASRILKTSSSFDDSVILRLLKQLENMLH